MADAIFLDCDGVVTDKHANVDKRVIFEAYRLAHSGKKIAFVSGRSLDWILRNIVPEIEKFSPSSAERARFFFVGECGNRWAVFSAGGISSGSDDSHSVSDAARFLIKNELSRFPYLFFDETKESFVSLEVRHNRLVSADAERDAQRQLDEARTVFSAKFPQLSAVRTLYAVDLMRKGVGKASALSRALELMGKVSSALVVGDSEIDLEMGEELSRREVPFEYFHVGAQELGSEQFKIRKSASPYAEGTLEILRGAR